MIRLATAADSEAILRIYSPFIRDTSVSFETEVPALNVFAQRIDAISKQYPYLVYQSDGEIVGIAYASRHRERMAYCYDVDTSIYVLPAYHGLGIADKLYGCLFAILEALGYYNAYAAFAVPNEKSERFHDKLGFTRIGTHHKTGYKLGKWHDVAWLEKTIQAHREKPNPVKSVHDLPEGFLKALFDSYAD